MSKGKPPDEKDAEIWRRIKPIEDFSGEPSEATGEITDVQGPPTVEDMPQVSQVVETRRKSPLRALLSRWFHGAPDDGMGLDDVPRTMTAEMEAAQLSARKRTWRWVVIALAVAALAVLLSPFFSGARN